MILEIKNLNISFLQYTRALKRRKLNIVKNLCLEVGEEVVAIIGESGSGKSLLAHSVVGLLPYNCILSGEIYYRGNLLNRDNIENFRGENIHLITQQNSLNPLLKIKNQIAKRDGIEEVFRSLNLDKKVLFMYPFELSGGMGRRVMLSEAMMSSADLIIADEPTNGMDRELVKKTTEFFKNLKKQKKSALIITHDIEMALCCADRIAIFFEGEIVENVRAEDFKMGNLKNNYSKLLRRALPENEFSSPTVEEVCSK